MSEMPEMMIDFAYDFVNLGQDLIKIVHFINYFNGLEILEMNLY